MQRSFPFISLSLCLALAACAPAPSSTATTASKPAGSANGSVVAPPKQQNARMSPVYMKSGGGVPTAAQVKKRIALTNGQKTGNLPATLELKILSDPKKKKGPGHYALDGVFSLADDTSGDEGMGLDSPAAEAKFEMNHPEQEEDPIFEAKGDGNDQYSVLATPDMVDLRDKMPEVRNQGQRGTCAHFAIAAVLDYMYAQQATATVKHASPQWMYFLYQTLVVSKLPALGKPFTDTGTDYGTFFPILSAAGNSDTSSGLPYIPAAQGYVDESQAPYVDTPDVGGDYQSGLAKLLPDGLRKNIQDNTPVAAQGAYFYAVKNDAASYEAALAGGQPISIGVPVYGDAWQGVDASTNFTIPELTADQAKDKSKLGGHAVVVAGYKRDASAPGGGKFLIRNSWGPTWADGGYCWVSYRFLLDYGSQAHVAQSYPAPFVGKFQLQPGNTPPDASKLAENVPVDIVKEPAETPENPAEGGKSLDAVVAPALPESDDGLPEEVGEEGDAYAENEGK